MLSRTSFDLATQKKKNHSKRSVFSFFSFFSPLTSLFHTYKKKSVSISTSEKRYKSLIWRRGKSNRYYLFFFLFKLFILEFFFFCKSCSYTKNKVKKKKKIWYLDRFCWKFKKEGRRRKKKRKANDITAQESQHRPSVKSLCWNHCFSSFSFSIFPALSDFHQKFGASYQREI